ncbi:MAG: metallophosphoesterase [Pseudopedobacter saltans]|uniref:Metallophosphoesterase n=1 Tax=Pseudopedobacter saltans TaxID=151895 RepID=A0A2W5FCX2_9SPHI|nr:MAG: metallophosphoesterase [Pseudopedobacter saltans]
MKSRRKFIKQTFTGTILGAVASLPIASLAAENTNIKNVKNNKAKLRFAIASDGHYAQPNTPFAENHENLVKWLTQEHRQQALDFIIINGDLVHDRPNLLPEVKTKYFDRFPVPYYTIPGNHDHADAALWKSVFGYEDNYSFTQKNIGFVLANTADTKGKYIAPDNKFLKRELDKMTNLPIVLVILHIPPHMWVPENFFVDAPDTIALLHKYPNVKAVFHGHDHTLDSVFYTTKLPHFFDGHYGGDWGTNYKGYRIVEINDDDSLQTYQVNASKDPILNKVTLK